MMLVADRRLVLLVFALALMLALTACGEEDDTLRDATTTTQSGAAEEAMPSATPAETPTETVEPAIPTTTTVNPESSPTATGARSTEASPTVPYVDLAPLDNPNLDVEAYWLGQRFEPGGDLPSLMITSASGTAPPGGGPADSRAEIQYGPEPFSASIVLRHMHRADWDAWGARDPASDDNARILHMFWDSPCAATEEVNLGEGHAVIYSSYQALADPSVIECPAGPFDRFLAHVFFGETVVLINAPHYFEDPCMPGFQGPYSSVEGMRAVVDGLSRREPESGAIPPTPVARLEDPGSLVLQPADLPGRYGYGDDGCSPAYECPIGPMRFTSEGGYGELSVAGGESVSLMYQYEHVGFTGDGQTPDPNIEPHRIDSFALICRTDCDPAAIMEVADELLRYHGHGEITATEPLPGLGDNANVYTINTLVFGLDAPGHAVIWRHGPALGMVVIGGTEGNPGRELVIGLATKQAERIERALGPKV